MNALNVGDVLLIFLKLMIYLSDINLFANPVDRKRNNHCSSLIIQLYNQSISR